MYFTEQKLSGLFSRFGQLKVMVIGDVMLDSYIWGKVERISPEAPVPVVSVQKREDRLGGAANVGLNLKALGAETFMCSVVGKDGNGKILRGLMQQAGLNDEGFVESSFRHTTTKFRVLGNHSQMLRIDDETTLPVAEDVRQLLQTKILDLMSRHSMDAIVFQDYDKGVISPELIDFVMGEAAKRDIPVTVDPKKLNFMAYHDVELFKPNLKELQEGLNLAEMPRTFDEIVAASSKLMEEKGAKIVLSTLSEKGVAVLWKEKGNLHHQLISAHLRNIADVSGAGDTVISVASLCLALKLKPVEIAALSNLAGGLVCEEVGVVPINKHKLLDEALKLLKTD
jgi:rfaE bifunctional protein kinase chain/domain